jgi:hypothetical protein
MAVSHETALHARPAAMMGSCTVLDGDRAHIPERLARDRKPLQRANPPSPSAAEGA